MSLAIEHTPTPRCKLAGRALARDWMGALEAIQVRAALGLPTQCELTFGGAALGTLSRGGWKVGAALAVDLPDSSSPLFRGEVTGIEQHYLANGDRQVRVRAYDALHRLRCRQTLAAHRQLSVVELARELAGGLGLKVESVEKGVRRRLVIQNRGSDLDLLRLHAEAVGLYPAVRDRRLLLLTLEGSGERVDLRRGSELFEARFDVDGSRPRGVVAGFGWDPASGEVVTGRARRGRRGGASPAAGQAGPVAMLDLGVEAAPQIKARAIGELDRAAGRELSLWGVARGDGRLQPGVTVKISGVDSSLEDSYVLTAVVHRHDRQSGFVSELSSYPPKPLTVPSAAAIVPALVTAVDDPDRLGRVKARLPTFGELETDWMRVVSPGLSGNRGLVALPDVGDQVAHALCQGDPARGLVLGGLFDGGSLDPGVEGGRVQRFRIQAGEQYLALDDKKGTVRVENQGGSYLELSSDGLVVHAAGNLRLEAPGKKMILRAARIDMEKG
ncbi:MAG: phage baseplate assembly protein V [Acidobacteriota bacterium]